MVVQHFGKILATVILAISSNFAFSSNGDTKSPVQHTEEYSNEASHHAASSHEGAVDTKAEINAYKNHHLADSHDFHLFSYGGEHGEARKHLSLIHI